jgi:hypothetical protein
VRVVVVVAMMMLAPALLRTTIVRVVERVRASLWMSMMGVVRSLTTVGVKLL